MQEKAIFNRAYNIQKRKLQEKLPKKKQKNNLKRSKEAYSKNCVSIYRDFSL